MIAYADTSFFASLYGRDANSELAIAEFRAAGIPIAITPLSEFEFANALEGRLFRREITARNSRMSRGAFHTDLSSGALIRQALPAALFDRAVTLASRYTSRYGTRSLDVLHVACAIELGASIFFTFDRRQHRLARAARLRVRPRIQLSLRTRSS